MVQSVLADVLSNSGKVLHALVSDLLAVPVRPVVTLHWLTGSPLPILKQFHQGGIFVGLLGCGSAVLIGISLGLLCGGAAVPLGRAASLLWIADAAVQLPKLLAPGSPVVGEIPGSWTGLPTLLLQLPGGLAIAGCGALFSQALIPRYACLSVAVSLRYTAMTLATPGGISAQALYALSAIPLAFAVTPRGLWRFLGICVARLAKHAAIAASAVYCLVAKLVPKVQAFVHAVLQHPLVVGVYDWILEPLWTTLSPWCMPCATAALSASLLTSTRNTPLNPGNALLCGGQLFCGVTATASAVALTLHAAGRSLRWSESDPLARRWLSRPLAWTASVIAFPWSCVTSVWPRALRLLHWLARPVLKCWSLGFKLATCSPVLAIPTVLAVNFTALWMLANSSSVLTRALGSHQVIADLFARMVDGLEGAKLSNMGDSAFVVLLVSVSQAVAFTLVRRTLREIECVRQARTGSVMSTEELNDIAVTMEDPRQCPQCLFGPVDSQGCDNLATHHGEIRTSAGSGSRSAVSNSCPRCGWFARRLALWQHWDPSLHTSAGEALFRRRAWGDTVVVVRASSKALVVPFAVLGLGQRLGLSSSASALLALSYLLPWAMENARRACGHRRPDARRRGSGRRSAAPRGASGDCGAARRGPELPEVTQSEALANLLAAEPPQVFLASGDICSVCLEAFDEDACKNAAGPKPAQALRRGEPPIVALRCGHALHVDCAEAAVAAAGQGQGTRHVRCPLCREPATLAGAASARLFS